MKIVIILSLLFVSIMFVQLCIVSPVASVTTQDVDGTIKIHPGKILSFTFTSEDTAHIVARQSATFFGSLKGLGVIYWNIYENLTSGEITLMTGEGIFRGYMNKKTGTFNFTTEGSGSELFFQCDWTIIGGTRDFSNIQGSGTLDGNLVTGTGNYSGLVVFNP